MLSSDSLNDKLKDKLGLSPATQAALHAPDLAGRMRALLSQPQHLGRGLAPLTTAESLPLVGVCDAELAPGGDD
ncbi:MAG: hypothetical protein IPJ18_00135 [Betaproteobacteria bacterium]|nr:hypothetical protein [Betaproteobacteria bacterium]